MYILKLHIYYFVVPVYVYGVMLLALLLCYTEKAEYVLLNIEKVKKMVQKFCYIEKVVKHFTDINNKCKNN